MEIWGSEIRIDIFGRNGGMDEIGIVVIIGEDGWVKHWKISETRIDVGIGDDTFRIVTVEVGSEVAAIFSSSLWKIPSSWISIGFLDSEFSWTTREGDLGFLVGFRDFFGALKFYKGLAFAFRLPPLFGFESSSTNFRNSFVIGQTPDDGCFLYSFMMAFLEGFFTNVTSKIFLTKVKFWESEILNEEVWRAGIIAIIDSVTTGTLKW